MRNIVKMIRSREIKPINSYVLFKPDPHYETYQLGGLETNIQSANYSYVQHEGRQRMTDVKERNYSVRGTVVAVPERLVVPDGKFFRKDNGVHKSGEDKGKVYDFSLNKSYSDYSDKVVQYNTTIEVKPGDRIFVSWRVHNNSDSVQTDEGEMLFVKYDQIVMVLDENDRPKKMVNGCILFEKVERELKKDEKGVEYTESKSGIVLPAMSQKSREVRNHKNILSKVKLCGSPLLGYKEFRGEVDEDFDIKPGELMISDIRGMRALEPLNHRHYKERYFYTRRKYVVFTETTARQQGLYFDKLM